MKKLIKVGILVLGLASGFTVKASIPTADGMAIGQAIENVKQMVELYKTTLGGWGQNHSDNQQMQKTSEEIRGELNDIHKGLSGNRTEVAKLASEKPQEVVEGDYLDKILKADENGVYSFEGSDEFMRKHGLENACKDAVGSVNTEKVIKGAGLVASVMSENKTAIASSVVDMITPSNNKKALIRCNKNATRLAAAQAMLKKINDNIKKREDQIAKYAERVKNTQDQKESADLTAAIAKANAEIDMDMFKSQLIMNAMKNQKAVDDQQTMIGQK